MSLSTRATVWSLAGIFVAALIVRLAVAVAFTGLGAPPNLSANPDQAEYEQITYNVSRGAGYAINGAPTAVRPPGFTITMLPVYAIFGRSFLAGRLLLILLSACTCLLAAWSAYQLSGPRAAVVAAAWLAVYPGHFYYAMHFLSETVYAFWLSAAVACTIAAFRSGSRRAGAGAGLLWTLAILTRVELIVVVPIAWLFALFQPGARRLVWARRLAAPTVVVLVVAAAWVGRNALVLGTPTLSTQRGCTFWGAHNDVTFTSPKYAGTWVNCSELVDAGHPIAGGEVVRERLAFAYGVASVRSHLPALPYLTAMKMWRLLSPFFDTPNRVALWVMAAGWMLAAPFVLAGLWFAWRRRRATRPAFAVLLAPMLALLATTVIFYGSTRYRDSMAPVLVVFAAIGLLQAAGVERT